VAIGFLLLNGSGNWRIVLIRLNCSRRLIPAIDTMAEAYFHCQLVGLLLSVICSGHPIELDTPHILALAAETSFLLYKEQVP
jgi:hypothetical protein